MERYEKLKLSLRYFLLGKGYFNAVDALEFAAIYHVGTRKDGVTPELQHQVEIAHYLRTLLPSFMYPEDTLTVALLHDLLEDYEVEINVIRARYGDRVADACALLDKNGKARDYYFSELGMDPIGSVVKGADRIHNLQSMFGAFVRRKQEAYVSEVETMFLPMLKVARRQFATQEGAYENIKHVLTSQVHLIKEIHMSPVSEGGGYNEDIDGQGRVTPFGAAPKEDA